MDPDVAFCVNCVTACVPELRIDENKGLTVNNKWVLTLAVLLTFAPLAFGAESPESYKNEADNGVRVAMQLEQQAVQMLQSGLLDREKLKVALNLYIQAGQLFEKASNTYKVLGAKYASSQDSDNAFQAMQGCLNAIKKIKERLESGV